MALTQTAVEVGPGVPPKKKRAVQEALSGLGDSWLSRLS